MKVPFFRTSFNEDEIDEVVECLRSGWLTTGPRTKQFEQSFAAAVGGKYAVAVNSCTAALHLAVEALGLKHGQAVLVPTLTFAATAEVIRYQRAVPILVDCDPVTFHIDLADAERKLAALAAGQLPSAVKRDLKVVGIIPVHVAGVMADLEALQGFAKRHDLWLVEDAAHSFPSAWRAGPDATWQRCGEDTSAVSCFSFYANKTITTGEGGMAVTDDSNLASRMRMMSLHGLSQDAWGRYSGGATWDYRIVEAGYKYNMTDVAASLGIHQLARAEEMRKDRERLALDYRAALADVAAIELPPVPVDRIHSWHLFPIRLRLDRLNIDRNAFMNEMRERGVGCSVHWRPLHLHPYYAERYGWQPEDLPQASAVWPRLVSLPLFPDMQPDEQQYVIDVVRELCEDHARS